MTACQFYIGTHASSSQPSIFRCEADFQSGTFTTLYAAEGFSNPSYLAGPRDGLLYVLGRNAEGGTVLALREKSDACSRCGSDGPAAPSVSALTTVSALSSGGQGPCHISADPLGEFLLCANYSSGSISLYDLDSDGRILSLCDFRQYSGTGFDSGDRQKGPHAHFAAFHSERDEVLVCDLGLDMVYVYELDRQGKKLRDTTRSIRLPDGSGPRHLIFSAGHPGMLCVLTEMANRIFVYQYEPVEKQYHCVQTISAVCDCNVPSGIAAPLEELMVPPTADNGSIGCAIRISADGKYLFVSSRLGYQSISAFRCGPDGHLTFCSRCLSGGITPRDFNLFEGADASAASGFASIYLLVACQDSDLITALRFDRAAESLTLLKMKMQAVKPTCILPIP